LKWLKIKTAEKIAVFGIQMKQNLGGTVIDIPLNFGVMVIHAGPITFQLQQMNGAVNSNLIMKEEKLAKVKISVDEKWPIFTAQHTNEEGPFIVEMDDDLYRQYLQINYLYYSFQTRLQVLYESEDFKLRERCLECFAESAKATANFILNYKAEPSK
jgi:hypothetical protein